jgi:hypothetical protein
MSQAWIRPARADQRHATGGPPGNPTTLDQAREETRWRSPAWGFSRNRSPILPGKRSPFSCRRSGRSERSDAGFSIVPGSDRFRENPQNSGEVTFQYDGDGNRVAMTAGGVTTTFLVDTVNPTGHSQVLEELVGGAVQRVYTYGSSRISQSQILNGAWATTFYGYDGQASVRYPTDASGAVLIRHPVLRLSHSSSQPAFPFPPTPLSLPPPIPPRPDLIMKRASVCRHPPQRRAAPAPQASHPGAPKNQEFPNEPNPIFEHSPSQPRHRRLPA